MIHKSAQPLLAASGVTIGSGGGTLTQESLNQAVDQAINYWRNAGIDTEAVSYLQQIRVEVADLSESTLGISSDTNYVWIDRDGAEYGWQLDAIGAISLSSSRGMDLLSVVAHELGHKLGLDHGDDDSDLMAPRLVVGEQKLLGKMDQSTPYLGTNWAVLESLRSEVAYLNNCGTVRSSVEDLRAVQARDQLFAKLDVASTKSEVRRSRITHDAVPDAWQIPHALDEGLLEDDLVEAIITAKLAARL